MKSIWREPEVMLEEGVSERAAKLARRLYLQACEEEDYAVAVVGAAAAIVSHHALAAGEDDPAEACGVFARMVADNLARNPKRPVGRA